MSDLEHANDVIKAMRQYGHDTADDGTCSLQCVPCVAYRTGSFQELANVEYEDVHVAILEALEESLNNDVGKIYHYAQMRMRVLATHPEVQAKFFESVPALVKKITMQLKYHLPNAQRGTVRYHTATVVIEPLYSMVGRTGIESYAPGDVPTQPKWREASSELKLGEAGPSVSPTQDATPTLKP